MVTRRRRLPPKPPESPAGYMYFYRQLMPIAAVEQHAKNIMGNHDNQPRRARDRANGIEKRFRLSKERPCGRTAPARRRPVRVIIDCPPDTVCVPPTRRRPAVVDATVVGGKSETLQPSCAETWFEISHPQPSSPTCPTTTRQELRTRHAARGLPVLAPAHQREF
jgi:hypothetical protein